MQVMNFSSTNCKNCYKCVRTCAVKAIEIKDDKANIIPERCVACGHCLIVCPQNARDVRSNLEQAMEAIRAGRRVVVSLAPSYRAYYEESDKFITALKQLGFTTIEETAIGAEVVSSIYEQYITESTQTEFITTCCPSSVRLIERYYSELIPYMLPIVSPMVAHGRMIKSEDEDAYTVFIGPCISKICESLSDEFLKDIDAVITFDEVTTALEERGIDWRSLDATTPEGIGTLRGTKYPVVGGVLNGIRSTLEARNLEVLRVHGMENCKEVLEVLRQGKLKNVCIEMNICNESCIAGPGGHLQDSSVFTRLQSIQRYLRGQNDVKGHNQREELSLPSISLYRAFKNKQVEIHVPTEEELVQVLESMGKIEKKDELNCGACGYNTCRDKAVAVLNGMSEINMCLPYTRSIAERLSNEIFHSSPNSIFILDKKCRIIDMNPAAEEAFGYKADLMKGKNMNLIMDDHDFCTMLSARTSGPKEKISLEAYDLTAYRDMIYLEKQKALLVIFTDITDDEKRKREVNELKVSTLDVTQSIIDKQMRVAQEIASLLGETTAETKVAIMKLRNVLQEEGEC